MANNHEVTILRQHNPAVGRCHYSLQSAECRPFQNRWLWAASLHAWGVKWHGESAARQKAHQTRSTRPDAKWLGRSTTLPPRANHWHWHWQWPRPATDGHTGIPLSSIFWRGRVGFKHGLIKLVIAYNVWTGLGMGVQIDRSSTRSFLKDRSSTPSFKDSSSTRCSRSSHLCYPHHTPAVVVNC
jgi:hypothetical protein